MKESERDVEDGFLETECSCCDSKHTLQFFFPNSLLNLSLEGLKVGEVTL